MIIYFVYFHNRLIGLKTIFSQRKRKMNNKKLILLTILLAILITTSGAAAFYLSTLNKNHSEDKIRIACVGDSITGGTQYPADLWMLLGSENYTVGNFGVGGSTAALDSWNPYINSSAFQEAKEFQPNIVIIMLGTNDANPLIRPNNGSFVNDYIKLVEEFQALSSNPKIYLVKPPPIFSNGTTPSAEYFRDNIIPTIEQAANQTNLPIIDVYSALANYSKFFHDGVHPDEQGAILIADEIYKAIILQNPS
jgi:lysophospholipase L1-like esterase